jgi:indolepyruvate ferredoxin oxidoreductase, beta subunit
MKCDIITAGVGGQGILSIAAMIAAAASGDGLHAAQSEVHGMSQRGGAVVAHLRLSDQPIHSPTIGRGRADLIISMEPLESLRYLAFLSPGGLLITSSEPVKNIPDYPDIDSVLATIGGIPGAVIVDAHRIARQAGSPKAANVVLVGAAAHRLPIAAERIRERIRKTFAAKGEEMVRINLEAFTRGQEVVQCQPA